MGQIVPDAVERYLESLNHNADGLLKTIAQDGAARGLPIVDAEVGALLRVLALAIDARRILEIGTAVGYSGIWLGGVLPPGGTLLTIEINPDRAREARENFMRAGLADRANVIVGDAKRMLTKISGPFDLIFQDGDKRLYSPFLDPLVARLRPRGLLVTDNVLWDGRVVPGFGRPADAQRDVEDTRAIADYNQRVAAHPHLITTVVPLRDGVSISVKR